MAFHVLPDGRIEAETLEDALAVQRAMLAASAQPQHVPRAIETRPSTRSDHPAASPGPKATKAAASATQNVWARFVAALESHQIAVLQKIRAGRRVERKDVVEAADQEGRSFARTMEGIKKAITEAGLQQKDIYTREAEGFGSKKVTYYVAGKKLLSNDL